jgi:hypothetical protein
MLEWLVKLLEQWSVVTTAPIPFAIAVVVVGAIIWALLSWSYGGIVSRRDAEIKLLERQISDLQQRRAATPQNELVDSAELRLLIHGDDRPPSRVSDTNIWRWYWLKNIVATREQDGRERRVHVTPILYINFDKPVIIGTLEVEADGFRLPLHEVKEFTNRFAIIVFSEDLPRGTLIIRVHR